jgi:cytochrome c556
MKRLTCLASATILLTASALATGRAGAVDAEAPTIKDVMGKLHNGPNAPLAKLKKSLKAEPPDWKDIQENTKSFATLGAILPESDPPKGDKANYKMLASAYSDNAKALDGAAKKEDLSGAQAAFGKLSTSCAACHKAHRPPKQ